MAEATKTKQEAVPFDPASINQTEQQLVSRVQSSYSSYSKAGAGFGEAVYQLHQAVRANKEKYLIVVDGKQQETGRLNAILNYLQIPRSTAYFWLRRQMDRLAATCPQAVIEAVVKDSLGSLSKEKEEHVASIRRAWLEANSPEQPTPLQIRALSTAAVKTTSAGEVKAKTDVAIANKLFLSFCQHVLNNFEGNLERANKAITPLFMGHSS